MVGQTGRPKGRVEGESLLHVGVWSVGSELFRHTQTFLPEHEILFFLPDPRGAGLHEAFQLTSLYRQ